MQKASDKSPGMTGLIIFVRNPVLGKVKTRLAITMGEEKALNIYGQLLQHTHHITQNLSCHKLVFYADYINENDFWENEIYQKELQEGDDLGARMTNAFSTLVAKGYTGICIIGSDCMELTTGVIEKAFYQLRNYDAVLGPSLDGGYYLLGMNRMIPGIFENKNWSTDEVLSTTVKSITDNGLSYFLLPALSDIDTKEDWEKYQSKKQNKQQY